MSEIETIIIEDHIDSAAMYRMKNPGNAMEVLLRAQDTWSAMSSFRKERRRNKEYTHGNQWGDYITVNGKRMTEEEYLVKQGNVPLKNNLIRRLVRSVIGVFNSQNLEPTVVARDRAEQQDGEVLSTVLQYNWQRNCVGDLNTRTFEEFLISGMMVHRKTFGWRSTGRGSACDCWTDMVSPERFFIDGNMQDFRTWDATIVGEIHDCSFEDVCRVFAKSHSDYDRLLDEYRMCRDRHFMTVTLEKFGVKSKSTLDFLTPADPSVCRVIEVWTKEQKERYHCHDTLKGECYKVELEDYPLIQKENEARIEQAQQAGMDPRKAKLIKTEYFIDDYWYYRFITPTGRVLDEGETPYKHGSHPYVFRCYPFIDGEIHSFVSDLIDQQRYVNRLITMQDFIMRSSAKGVLLVPTDCIPDGMNLDDFAEAWSSYNGVVAFKAKAGVPLPQQIHGNATNIGIADLLQLQLKFFEDISGVHGALQGQVASSSTSGVLYEQQTQNATMSLLDLLDVIRGFIVDCAVKDLNNIQQFYDEAKVMQIAGRTCNVVVYEPEKHSDIEFDMSITESTSTAAYRQAGNEFLMQLLQAQQISVEQLLEFGSFPNADALLQSIQAAKEQTMQQQQQLQAAQAQQQPAPGNNLLEQQ